MLAAIQVVGQHGLTRLNYRSVAAEAGVSHALVRHHFGTLDTLVSEAYNYCVEVSMAATDGYSGSDLRDFLNSVIDESLERPDILAFFYEVALGARRDRALASRTQELYIEYRKSMERTLARLGYVGDVGLSTLVFTLVDGLIFQVVAMAHRDRQFLDDAVDSFCRMADRDRSPTTKQDLKTRR